MQYAVREVLKRLRSEGWIETPGKGSHRVFRKEGQGNISVPNSYKNLPKGTYKTIAKKAGWE
jgi:predicted RNA binding protein YcfA (HicA-like mRNA interferase family)